MLLKFTGVLPRIMVTENFYHTMFGFNSLTTIMNVAPEHTKSHVLSLMGKPSKSLVVEFKKMFDEINARIGKKQFLTYYFIAAHPGCTLRDMESLAAFARQELKMRPEQVQIFPPTPSTFSTLMYYTEKNPANGEHIFVEKDPRRKDAQKRAVKWEREW